MELIDKTKEELIIEMLVLRKELATLHIQYETEKREGKKLEVSLTERVKELNCHNRISELMIHPDNATDNIFQAIVNLIPPAWQVE